MALSNLLKFLKPNFLHLSVGIIDSRIIENIRDGFFGKNFDKYFDKL